MVGYPSRGKPLAIKSNELLVPQNMNDLKITVLNKRWKNKKSKHFIITLTKKKSQNANSSIIRQSK